MRLGQVRRGLPCQVPVKFMQLPAVPPLRPGDLLAGKYRIERTLGEGAMGIVFAARHIDLQELRAIKLMLPSALGDAAGIERFLREARAAVRLRSRYIARVLDIGRTDDGAPFIVMEHLEGSDLRVVLESAGALPVLDAIRYVAQACEGIAEAHAAGIVHRDLKPANLFLAHEPNGEPCIKVLDFGIAKVGAAADAPALEMTKTAEVIGTPMFMSPEQMRSTRDVDARADVWALGVILFRALTGQAPFHGTTITQLCAAVVADPAPPLSSLRAGLPFGLEAIVFRCLEKDPGRRYANAAELGAALTPFLGGGTAAQIPMPLHQLSLPDATVVDAPTWQTTGKAGAWQQPQVPSQPASASQSSPIATLLMACGAAFVLALGAAGIFALVSGRGRGAPAAAPTSAVAVAAIVASPVSAPLASSPAPEAAPPPPSAATSAKVAVTASASVAPRRVPVITPPPPRRDSFDSRK
jgi:serine/threonine protein kinase